MAEEKKLIKMQHNLIMENRKTLTVTGVMDIDSFDEQSVIVFTEQGELTIRGENLHINKIDVDTGEMLMEGDIDSLGYSDAQPQKGGLFARLFR